MTDQQIKHSINNLPKGVDAAFLGSEHDRLCKIFPNLKFLFPQKNCAKYFISSFEKVKSHFYQEIKFLQNSIVNFINSPDELLEKITQANSIRELEEINIIIEEINLNILGFIIENQILQDDSTLCLFTQVTRFNPELFIKEDHKNFCLNLTELHVGLSLITHLNINSLKSLKKLSITSVLSLSKLEMIDCDALEAINISSTVLLKNITLPKNVQYFKCTANASLKEIHVQLAQNSLEFTYCNENNSLKKLNMSKCVKLTTLECLLNPNLTDLNCSGCVNLISLKVKEYGLPCYFEKLKSFNIAQTPETLQNEFGELETQLLFKALYHASPEQKVEIICQLGSRYAYENCAQFLGENHTTTLMFSAKNAFEYMKTSFLPLINLENFYSPLYAQTAQGQTSGRTVNHFPRNDSLNFKELYKNDKL